MLQRLAARGHEQALGGWLLSISLGAASAVEDDCPNGKNAGCEQFTTAQLRRGGKGLTLAVLTLTILTLAVLTLTVAPVGMRCGCCNDTDACENRGCCKPAHKMRRAGGYRCTTRHSCSYFPSSPQSVLVP